MATMSFEQLYRSVFPHIAQDRLDNYSHVRLLQPISSSNSTQFDVVRPIRGPAARRPCSQLCVLKCIPVPRNDVETQRQILQEVAIHRAVSLGSEAVKDRILPLQSHFISSNTFGSSHRKASDAVVYLVLVLPYCPKGSLSDFIIERLASQSVFDEKKGLDESELRWVILELVKALQRCHDRGVVHQDVKAEHIFLWQGKNDPSSVSNEGEGALRLLLGGFSSSKWIDEESDPDAEGDSTLCGSGDSKTSGRRPLLAIQTLGHLCIFLLTGTSHAQHPDDASSSSSMSDVRVEEKPSTSLVEELQSKLPQSVSRQCRDFIDGMLKKKTRLTIEGILQHPFMKSSLPVTPLQGREKDTNVVVKHRVKMPSVVRSSRSEAEGSSTTLLSVMQRVSPAIFHPAESSRVEKRKTPFGVIKLAKEQKERFRLTSASSWGEGYGTRGLVSVRQRIKGGKIQITREGRIMLTLNDNFLALSASGRPLTRHPQDDAKVEELYNTAAKWLKHHRQRSTLAGFMLPSLDRYLSTDEASRGAVEYIGYCSVKGNGPRPDYEVRFAAIEDGVKRHDEWNVQVQVQVQRSQSRLKLLTQLQGNGKRVESSWKETVLTIKASKKESALKWNLAGNARTSVIVKELSSREARAIERSLQACHSVDSIFHALMGE
jgi:serine/threonine protein kinase